MAQTPPNSGTVSPWISVCWAARKRVQYCAAVSFTVLMA
jgi:hypothetical protein